MELEKYFTVAEIADKLSVSQVAVRKWLTRGTLRSVRVSRCRRIPESALKELIHEAVKIKNQ